MSGSGRVRFGAALLALASVLLAGCELIGAGGAGPQVPLPYPAGCPAFDLSPGRCAAIVDALASRAGIVPHEATAIELLGDSCAEGNDGTRLCTRTTQFVVRVRFTMADGTRLEESQFCGVGGQFTILCTDDPEIHVGLPTEAYFDVPCSGDDMSSCATRMPGPDTAAAAAEQPIDVPHLDVPIDHAGAFGIEVGHGSLANGILEESGMSVNDQAPAGFLLDESGVRLLIESLEPDGRPFDNYYLHGRREGVERFRATLRFNVLSFEPGAVLTIQDIYVR